MIRSTLFLLALSLGAASLVAATHHQDLHAIKGVVRVDGSSTLYPITEAVTEEFTKVAPKIRVTVGVSGSGGGFKRFTAGEIDIAEASRPIKAAEAAIAAKHNISFVEIPVAFDALTFVVNPKNGWVKSLTVGQIKHIYSATGTAKTWKDVDASWPDRPIKVFSPGTDSGTFDYFKEVVVGKEGSIRSDMSVSEDDNALVTGVAGDTDSIGYFGLAYFAENTSKLRAVPVDGGAGAVAPTPVTVIDGTYVPFSRPLFVYVNTHSAERPEVKAFVDYYLSSAAGLAEEVGYVPLPPKIAAIALANWTAHKSGSVYVQNGVDIGGSFSDLYK